MIAAALLLIATAPDAVAAPSCEYCGAIFDDIQRNAMIGNGNIEVSLEWVEGNKGDDVSIRIEDLTCPDGRKWKRCSFALRRVLTRGGVATIDPALPERLRCVAILKWSRFEKDWAIEHSPPPRGAGHSATSMTCKRIETNA
jgi:hypothetical protein